MIGLFKNLFKGKKITEADQTAMLKSGDVAQLKKLAESPDTNPEILYYLAKSDSAEVRQAVALNKATPVQASTLLANDESVDVRYALAARLVELLPDLSIDKQSQLYACAVQALGILAQNEVLKIRKALTTALKDYAKAPPSVVNTLARDIEREISEPILRFCVALTDDDLFDILSGHPEPWVVSAIAGRPTLSERLSEAVVDSDDLPATGTLVSNVGANLSAQTLQTIIEKAREYPEWHPPIAMRKELSLDLARQLAGFASAAVLSVLEKRSDFDAATRTGIANMVKRRMEFQRSDTARETAEEKARRYIDAQKLTPDVIEDALSWGEMEFAYLAFSHLSGIHPVIVKKMLSTGSAKPVVALCWKSKLSMRLCVEVQKTGAKLQPKDFMYAKGGTDYPLTMEELKWQLEFFGVK